MHYIYRNVNDAFEGLVAGIDTGVIKTVSRDSRNGRVMRIPGPAIITYNRPRERVLYNPYRDANPFFHLFESLWMLAGRKDIAPLLYYLPRYKNYSDDGVTAHGAYGYRWREWMGYDQLELIGNQLFHNHDDRRAVLQMWDANALNDNGPGMNGRHDLYVGTRGGKDVPCNIAAVFEVDEYNRQPALNMTVFNRSNDLLWGMLGANVVHFSFLQEYMAHRVGTQVGKYHQVSANLHVYENEHWKPDEFSRWYRDKEEPQFKDVELVPLVKNVNEFDEQCKAFVDNQEVVCTEPFLRDVAQPLCTAFRHHKERDYPRAYEAAKTVQSPDWSWVAVRWLRKREYLWRRKQDER